MEEQETEKKADGAGRATVLHVRGFANAADGRVAIFPAEGNLGVALELKDRVGADIQVRAYFLKEQLPEALALMAAKGLELDVRSPEGH